METANAVVDHNSLNLLGWQRLSTSPVELPDGFPQDALTPKFQLGDRCRWIPAPSSDWGTVIGHVYAPVITPPSDTSWIWIYLLLLDADSPSQAWIIADWVEETELEALPVPFQ